MVSPCQRQGIQTAISPEGCLDASPLPMRTGPKSSSPLCVDAQSLLLCLILCDAVDCGPPGSSVHGILQARILKSCPPPVIFPTRGSVCVSCIVGGFFTYRATQEAPHLPQHLTNQAHPPMYTGLFTVNTTAVTLFIEWLTAGSVIQTCRFESRLFQLKARVSWKSTFNLPVPQFLHLYHL